MTNQERARQILQRLVSIYPSTLGSIGADDEPGQRLEAAIAAALAQRERETWEQAANQLDYYNDDPNHFSASLQTIVDRWRAQAKEVQP